MAAFPKKCANLDCLFHVVSGGEFVRIGHFKTKRNNSRFQRYRCKGCIKSFSSRTLKTDFRQKKPDLNIKLWKLLCEGVSLRAAGRILNLTYRNTYQKFLWLGEQAQAYKKSLRLDAEVLYFDEMETIEHTKCKPLSIALMVNENYEILEAKVARMPAKGKLAAFSVSKYGRREDERERALFDAFKTVKLALKCPPKLVLSDAKSSYRKHVVEHFPKIPYQVHSRNKSKDHQQSRIHEKKQKRLFDPMFALNQRCAKLRSDIKRLVRRSWCTTKKPENLQLHLDLYIAAQFAA